MIRRVLPLAAAFAALAVAPLGTPAGAQVRLPTQPPIRQLGPSRQAEDTQPIPPAYRPPPGMCRIWLENVQPSQQPAPTDCVSAVRNRPTNARVIFGDDYVDKRGKDRGKDKRPESHVDAGVVRLAEPMDALAPRRGALLLAGLERVHGPQAGDSFEPVDVIDETMDARSLDAPGVVVSAAANDVQPPARRRAPAAAPRDSVRPDARQWQEPRLRRDSTLSERRRALRDRLRPRTRDDRDDDFDDRRLGTGRGGRALLVVAPAGDGEAEQGRDQREQDDGADSHAAHQAGQEGG